MLNISNFFLLYSECFIPFLPNFMATCLDYALKYISAYPKTEHELKTKLFTKKFNESDIDFAIEFLKKKWFLDDKQFARLYINSELIKKGKVPELVKQKLLQKWVDKEIIKEHFVQAENEIQQWIYERIRKEIEKLKKKWLEWYDIMVKISQKGYKITDIKNALK